MICRADADEVPELADFAETAATVFHEQRAYPMALLMTPEGLPLGIVVDGFFQTGIDALLARHGTLPPVRLADDANLQAIRVAQRPQPAKGTVTADLPGARATALAGGRGGAASLGSLLLLAEAHETLHSAPAATALSRALASSGRPPSDRLDTLAWRLHLHAQVAAGPGPDAAAAAEIVSWTASHLLDDTGLFRAGSDDPRLLTAATGTMIGALARVGVRLGRPAATQGAVRCAERLLERMGPPAALRRGEDSGRSLGPARLDDYASLGLGLLALHEATSDGRWLAAAEAVADAAVAALWDSDGGGFYLQAEPVAPLPVRIKSGFDGERPAANALLALLLDDVGDRSGRTQLRVLARRTVEAFAGDWQRAPAGMDGLLAAALRVLPAPSVPTPVATTPSAPARLVRGAVTLEARLEKEALRRGERTQVQLDVRTSDGWTVTPHRPADRAAVGLSVTLLEPDLGAGAAVYPAAAERLLTARVPLRVPPGAAAGRREVRVTVRFEACAAGRACERPERVTLGVPLTITP